MSLSKCFLPFCDHEYVNRGDNAENCQEVAYDFAIKFSEWLIHQDITSREVGFYVNCFGEIVSTKDLLTEFTKL